MTPYTKKIVELHKIHKAIEEKDCCNGGGGNTPSGNITIDDVVKFIHDSFGSYPDLFPYVTWDEIPNIADSINAESGIYKATNENDISRFNRLYLATPSYIIGYKERIGG